MLDDFNVIDEPTGLFAAIFALIRAKDLRFDPLCGLLSLL